MQPTDKPLALDHLRVLELPGLAGAYCGKLLADLGADVIKIEPPGGDPIRFTGPYAGDIEDPERSLPFINFHTNKRSAVLDLDTDAGRAALRSLIPTVDVVLDSYQPGYLDSIGLGYDDLKAINPAIILTSVTTFGQTGPYSQYLGGDLLGGAMSGMLGTQGDPDFPPANAPLYHATQLSSIHAAVATLFVLAQRPVTGKGDHVDVSIQEVFGHINFALARYEFENALPPRPGAKALNAGINAYPVQDGWVHIYTRRWDRLKEWLNLEEFNSPEWRDNTYRRLHADDADPIIARFTANWTKATLTEESQRRGIPAAPVSTPADLVNSPQLQARGFWVDTEHPVLGQMKVPGAPYQLSETPWRLRRATPRLGEHTAEVLAEASQPRPRIEVRARSDRPQQRPTPPGLPFAGTRVLDFSIAFAGPYATRYMGELGAEIIKVESNAAETNTGGSGPPSINQVEINRSKRSITLDLHHARAQELARELAKISDFAIANFRPFTLDRWNVGYQHLKEVRPDIIMAEMPGFGSTGPQASYISLGNSLMAYSGLTRLWGFPGSPENNRCKIAYPDWIGAGKVTLAMLAAHQYRQRTGKGQYIEVAQVEAAAAMGGVAYMDYLFNGRLMDAQGNHHHTFAPHSIYPSRGDDRWVAIAVQTDEQWANMVRALGEPEWARDEALATAAGRKAREDVLDAQIAAWTKQLTPHQAMRLLQKAGVPAAAVQNGEDVYLDPHLRARGYTVEVEQPILGTKLEPGLTMRFKETPETQPRGMALMGEANEYVFGELLGLSTAEIRQLIEDKIIN